MRLTLRGKLVLAVALVSGAGLVAAAAGALYLRGVGVWGTSDPGTLVELEVTEGATLVDIAAALEERGVVRSATGVRIAAFLRPGTETIQAGTYELPTGLTAGDAIDRMLDGPVVEFVTVTFPEGSWLTDFARIVERDTHIDGDEFLTLVESGGVPSPLRPSGVGSMEGLLFPSTYQVVEDDTAESLARRLTEELAARVGEIDLAPARRRGLTPYEVVIVASMIEAETRVDAERRKVAAVIYNRLAREMALGIDATILYALGERKAELTVSDLAVDSPYNTREHTGLPPTPIGAPGEASLRAAANPAPVDLLYYVLADCSGNHAFSSSYDAFLQDKAAYRALDC